MWETHQKGYFRLQKRLPFRAWWYFRTGYTQYFSFILALGNMFTITYYLVIVDNPFLGSVLPNFSTYIVISSIIGIPLLSILGFVHMRRSLAYTSDVEIVNESNPFNYKLYPGIHKECMAPLLRDLLRLGRKSISNETLSENEQQKLDVLQKNLEILADGRSLPIPKKFDEV